MVIEFIKSFIFRGLKGIFVFVQNGFALPCALPTRARIQRVGDPFSTNTKIPLSPLKITYVKSKVSLQSNGLNRRGFSLLEILIVMTILATLAVISSNAIKAGMKNKNKIQARLRVETMVYDALHIMAADIEKAFNYQQPFYELDRIALTGQQQNANNAANPAAPPQQVPLNANGQPIQGLAPKPEKLTQFIGKEKSLYFTTLNNQRTTANAQESNIIEVGYFIKSCKNRTTGKSSDCLWRKTSIVLDNDVTRGGTETPLVENVSQFTLEYLNQDYNDKEWKREWISDRNGSAITQNRFPYLVKITLEVEDKDNKDIAKFGQTIIANVRFPNNINPATAFSPTGGGTGTTGTTPQVGPNGF